MPDRRLGPWLYGFLLAATIALDSLLVFALLPVIGGLLDSIGVGGKILVAAMLPVTGVLLIYWLVTRLHLLPLYGLWLISAVLWLSAVVGRQSGAVRRGLVVILLNGASVAVMARTEWLQGTGGELTTPPWAGAIAVFQGLALILTILWLARSRRAVTAESSGAPLAEVP